MGVDRELPKLSTKWFAEYVE